VTHLPVIVSKRGESRVRSGHPWIFKSDVSRAAGVGPGSVVRVLGPTGRPLGFAFFSARSEITLRMIERGDTLSPTFVRDRLLAARAWREAIAPGVEALRLVHGEGDGLPSLIVDRYGEYLVVQTLAQATDARKAEIVAPSSSSSVRAGSWNATTPACARTKAWPPRSASCTARCRRR